MILLHLWRTLKHFTISSFQNFLFCSTKLLLTILWTVIGAFKSYVLNSLMVRLLVGSLVRSFRSIFPVYVLDFRNLFASRKAMPRIVLSHCWESSCQSDVRKSVSELLWSFLFLGATKHLYNWLCPSVGWLVGRSVCGVAHSFDDPHVAPYWPTWPCFLDDHSFALHFSCGPATT